MRLAASDPVIALLWAVSLLGVFVVPTIFGQSRAAGAVALAIEIAALAAALALSATWLRGQRAVVVEDDALTLQGALDRRTIGLSAIARLEIEVLATADQPSSRVTLVLNDARCVRIDLPRQDAAVLCRTVQQRRFGGDEPPTSAELRQLRRKAETIAAWSARVRQAAGSSIYRQSGKLSEAALRRALYDPALPVITRIGAALALRGPKKVARDADAGRDEGLPSNAARIGEQLETASLRIAVRRAIEGTLDDEALAAVDAEEAELGRSHVSRSRSDRA